MNCCGADPAAALERLKDNARAGRRLALFPFYGHRPGRSGVGPWVLSQWAPLPFTVDGVTYPHAEAFMMASKARLFHDQDALEQILQGGSPARVKALGRAVRSFDQAMWDEHAFGFVVQGNIAKFNQNLAARQFDNDVDSFDRVHSDTYEFERNLLTPTGPPDPSSPP